MTCITAETNSGAQEPEEPWAKDFSFVGLEARWQKTYVEHQREVAAEHLRKMAVQQAVEDQPPAQN